MRTLAVPLVLCLLGCQVPFAPSSALELLCSPDAEPPAYGDFYWDELRRRDPMAFERAREICSQRCPQSASCGPVLTVAGWYAQDLTVPEDIDPSAGEGGAR